MTSDCSSVWTTEILINIRDCTVRTNVSTLTASVTHVFIWICSTWIVLKLIFYQKTDCLCCCTRRLSYSFRNIFWTLTASCKEDTGCRRFYRTELCMCFKEEVVVIHRCCKHSCQWAGRLVCFDRSRKNYHISLDVNLFVQNQI